MIKYFWPGRTINWLLGLIIGTSFFYLSEGGWLPILLSLTALWLMEKPNESVR